MFQVALSEPVLRALYDRLNGLAGTVDVVKVCKDLGTGNDLYTACVELHMHGLLEFDTESLQTEIHERKKVIVGIRGHLTESGLEKGRALCGEAQ